eukprot:gene6076-6779_t
MDEHSILSSTLSCGEKYYHACLTKSLFMLYPKENSPQADIIGHHPTQRLHLREIFAITYEAEPVKGEKLNSNNIEMFPSNRFAIHSILKCRNHKWKAKKMTFNCYDSHLCQKWYENFQKILSDFKRPKNLLIFVNPVGGKKLAVKIFREKISPLFSIAGIKQEVVVTERAKHAHSIITNTDLNSFDGIIAVGGDGMFSEILNGVLSREECTNKTKPNIKLGIIPAGSTDTVVYCTTGINDPMTSALHILIGDELPIDICSVWHGDELLKYSVSLMGYGFFGDVIKESEQLRWMGPRRYDFAGFRNFMANRSYVGEVSYIPAPENQSNSAVKEKCIAGCGVCLEEDSSLSSDTDSSWKSITGRFISVIGANITCRCAKSLDGISPHAHLGDGYFDLILIRKTTRLQYLRHMLRMANRSDHLGFDFVEVFKVKEFKFHPIIQRDSREDDENYEEQRANDNKEDLILREVSRRRSTPVGGRRNEHSVWNIDGELVDKPSLYIKNHRKLVSIYARGIEDFEETPGCGPC